MMTIVDDDDDGGDAKKERVIFFVSRAFNKNRRCFLSGGVDGCEDAGGLRSISLLNFVKVGGSCAVFSFQIISQ